jgi:hypothetical protein
VSGRTGRAQAADAADAADAEAEAEERKAYYARVEQQLGLKHDELMSMNARQRRHVLRRRLREVNASEVRLLSAPMPCVTHAGYVAPEDSPSRCARLRTGGKFGISSSRPVPHLQQGSTDSNGRSGGGRRVTSETERETTTKGRCAP